MEKENQSITSNLTGEDEKRNEAEKAGPSRMSECFKLDDNTLNPSVNHLCKKSEVNDQQTNTQVTFDHCMITIVPIEFPKRKLSSKEVFAVRKLVKNRIYNMPNDARLPRFFCNNMLDGGIIFNCADKETGEWLSNLIPELTLDVGIQLGIRDKNISKRHRAVIQVKDPTLTIEKVLYLLEKQNEGLVTNDWIFVSESRNAKSTRFFVYFEDSSLEVLEALKFKPFCALSRALIKVKRAQKEKAVQ